MTEIKTLLFDFDGTLHNTIKIYLPALQQGFQWIAQKTDSRPKKITEEYAASLLGYPPMEAWTQLFPHVEKKLLLAAMKQVGDHMNLALQNHEGELYPRTRETLSYLQDRGYTMYLISNSSNSYLHIAADVFLLRPYFKEIIAAQSYCYQPKETIFQSVLKYEMPSFAAIGDRFHDMAAAEKNHMVKIFCSYGFGKAEEGKTAHFHLQSIDQLQNIL